MVPSGLLEAVAWTNTHMVHLNPTEEACSGIPQAYGIMGLHDNGENYFIENGAVIASLSGISIEQQKASLENQIAAYASCDPTCELPPPGVWRHGVCYYSQRCHDHMLFCLCCICVSA
jgi:hypothetical protein